MSLLDDCELKAAALNLTLKRGPLTNAGYEVRDAAGAVAYGEGFTGGLKHIDKFLVDYLAERAEAVELKLTRVKPGLNLAGMSAAELRNAQQAATPLYVLERRDVVTDTGRAEESQADRDDRFKRQCKDVVMVTEFGPATFQEVARYIDDYAADTGADDDVEVDRNSHLKKVKAPTKEALREAAAGSDAETIKLTRDADRDYGERKGPLTPEQRRAIRAYDGVYRTRDLQVMSWDHMERRAQMWEEYHENQERKFQALEAENAKAEASRKIERMFPSPKPTVAPARPRRSSPASGRSGRTG
jgi:hypothetical protein